MTEQKKHGFVIDWKVINEISVGLKDGSINEIAGCKSVKDFNEYIEGAITALSNYFKFVNERNQIPFVKLDSMSYPGNKIFIKT